RHRGARDPPALHPGATLHAGGRLPAPHRTDADRLMAIGTPSPRSESGSPLGDEPGSRLVAGPRRELGRGEQLQVLLAYHWVLFKRSFLAAVVSRFLMPVLFLASMGLGVGSLVDSNSGGVDGMPSLLYVVPGLVMVTAMTVAVGESTYPVMGFVKWNEFYRAMIQTPHRVKDML